MASMEPVLMAGDESLLSHVLVMLTTLELAFDCLELTHCLVCRTRGSW